MLTETDYVTRKKCLESKNNCNILTKYLKQLHDENLRHGYSQKDCAIAHTSEDTIAFMRKFLIDTVSLHAHIDFPPRSPFLTIMDYFVFPCLDFPKHISYTYFDLILLRQNYFKWIFHALP